MVLDSSRYAIGSFLVVILLSLGYIGLISQTNISRMPKQYKPEILKGDIVVFIVEQEETSLVYVNERKKNEGYSEDSRWIRYEKCWKETADECLISDTIIVGLPILVNVPDSVFFI